MANLDDGEPPLRILHLTAASDAGGLSRYIFDLGSAMHARGHQITVAGGRGASHALFESAPFPWVDIRFKRGPIAIRKAARELNRHLDEYPADLLHVHYRRCALVARRIQQHVSIPTLYTLHLSNIPIRWPWGMLTNVADHIHAPSDEALEWLVQSAGVKRDRISMIPHGVSPERFPLADADMKRQARLELGLKDNDLVAAFVGRLDWPKNEGWMLDMAAASRTKLADLKVILLGEGPHEATLRRRIQDEKLDDRVMMLGHRDPRPIYQAADALLLPSAQEGFSLVCAEAMCTGIPVLRTRTAGTHGLVIENETGVSVPIDHDAFVAGAIAFLADRSNLRRMGEVAASHVRKHFSFERQLRDTIDLYRAQIRLHATGQ